MIKSLVLHNFKKHKDLKLNFLQHNIIYWDNWSWKTNILDAIYLVINWNYYSSEKVDKVMRFLQNNFFVETEIEDENGLLINRKITYYQEIEKTTFLLNKNPIIKSKFISFSNNIATFFSPQEMNIMYLWPSLRRDFLDEILTLSYPWFNIIKNEYSKVLKNRNKILKKIHLWEAKIEDINQWDNLFIQKASLYYSYRFKLLDYFSKNIAYIESMLENKYKLKLFYETKINRENLEQSITDYLKKNIDRDIILGYTYIWPHLDDFYFQVLINEKEYPTSSILSRWENKSILIALKFLEIEFYEKISNKKIVILLDDIFSELDNEHMRLVLEKSSKHQTFITTQNLPNFSIDEVNFSKILIN